MTIKAQVTMEKMPWICIDLWHQLFLVHLDFVFKIRITRKYRGAIKLLHEHGPSTNKVTLMITYRKIVGDINDSSYSSPTSYITYNI